MGKQSRIREQRRLNGQSNHAATKSAMNPVLLRVLYVLLAGIIVGASVWGIWYNTNRKEGTQLKKTMAIEVNGEKYSAAEVAFYYNMVVKQYYNYNMQFYSTYGMYPYNVDFDKDLFKQTYDTESGKSWGSFFLDQAVDTLYGYILQDIDAREAGYVLTEDQQKDIDDVVETVNSSAAMYGYSTKQYLKLMYGNSTTEELFKKCVTREIYSTSYGKSLVDSYEISQTELNERYATDKKLFDLVNYASFTVTVTLPTHVDADGKTYSNETTKAEDEAFLVAKLTEFKEKVAAVTDFDSFAKLAEEQTRKTDSNGNEVAGLSADQIVSKNVAHGNLDETMQTWMFDDTRKEGDTDVQSSDTRFTAYFFMSRETNDYLPRSIRHLLISTSGVTDEAKLEEFKTKAEELLSTYEAGEKTEDAFMKLVKENSADPGEDEAGLYENIALGELSEEMETWLYDESRVAGDVTMIKDDGGYHILYFVEISEQTYRDQLVDDVIREDRYTEHMEDLKAEYILKRYEKGMSLIK